MSNQKIALILSGCGHIDGSEITEAVSLMIAFGKNGYQIDYYAPDRPQADVINHIKGEAEGESRNIRVEAARIARGNIKAIDKLDVTQYTAIALPGGFGVVKNFTNFIEAGKNSKLKEDIAKPLHAALNNQIPVVAICAAPLALAMAAHEVNLKNVEISFGAAANAADFLAVTNEWGIKHIETKIDECHVDKGNKLITSGAYMYGDSQSYQIFEGANACVKALNDL